MKLLVREMIYFMDINLSDIELFQLDFKQLLKNCWHLKSVLYCYKLSMHLADQVLAYLCFCNFVCLCVCRIMETPLIHTVALAVTRYINMFTCEKQPFVNKGTSHIPCKLTLSLDALDCN